jgi:hypothetical protein
VDRYRRDRVGNVEDAFYPQQRVTMAVQQHRYCLAGAA